MIDIKTLKKIFKDNPNKSIITFKGKCLDCGCKVIIDIICVQATCSVGRSAAGLCLPGVRTTILKWGAGKRLPSLLLGNFPCAEPVGGTSMK